MQAILYNSSNSYNSLHVCNAEHTVPADYCVGTQKKNISAYFPESIHTIYTQTSQPVQKYISFSLSCIDFEYAAPGWRRTIVSRGQRD